MKKEKIYHVPNLDSDTLVNEGPLGIEIKGNHKFGTGSVHWYGTGIVQLPDGRRFRVTGVEGEGSRFKNIAASDGDILIEQL